MHSLRLCHLSRCEILHATPDSNIRRRSIEVCGGCPGPPYASGSRGQAAVGVLDPSLYYKTYLIPYPSILSEKLVVIKAERYVDHVEGASIDEIAEMISVHCLESENQLYKLCPLLKNNEVVLDSF